MSKVSWLNMLLFSRFVGPVLLCGASFLQQPPQPIQATPTETTCVYLEPSPELGLPPHIADYLTKHRYKIPWVVDTDRTRNVVSGHFGQSAQQDWTVLASLDGYSTVLVFWGGTTTTPAYVARRKDDPLRALHRATPEYIRERYRRYGGPTPPPSPLDRDGIDDGLMGKGSSVWYFHKNRWIMLTGAD